MRNGQSINAIKASQLDTVMSRDTNLLNRACESADMSVKFLLQEIFVSSGKLDVLCSSHEMSEFLTNSANSCLSLWLSPHNHVSNGHTMEQLNRGVKTWARELMEI